MKRLLPLILLATSTALADDLERTVATMARIGFANSPSLSPDGKSVAFLSNMSGSPQIWVVSTDGGWPDQVTALDDPVTSIDWSPDGKWIAFQLAPGGGLNSQIAIVRPDGTGMKQLTEGGKVNNWLATWTPDGKSIAISSNRRDGAAMDSWLLDPAGGPARLVARNPGIGTIVDVSPDGKFALVQRVASRGDNDLYRISLEGGEEIRLTPHTPPAEFEGAFGADGRTVYVSSNAGQDLTQFGRVTVDAKGKPGPFEALAKHHEAELDGFIVNNKGTIAFLAWNRAGRNELAMLELQTRKMHPVPPFPGDNVFASEFSDDDAKVALVNSGSNRPADVWILDMGSKKIRPVTRSPHAGVDLEQLVKPELVEYTAHDGLKLSGWLYKPKSGGAPYPTVFSFHGGPEGQERPSFNTTYQALLSQGIAVFAPNVRGSWGFGKKFVNLDNGALRVNAVRDIQASVDHLVKTGITDARRAGIMGGSYGGYMVMAGLTEYPDMFAGGANLFGVVNFETFFQHSEPWMAAISTIEYGNPKTEAAMLRSLSPIHKIDRVKAPMLVLHGANDTNVPVIEAEQVVENLKKRSVPVEYVLFPDEGHGWRKTPNRIRSAVEITRFFVKHLKPAGPVASGE
jgi:dipeptidyl aminopeptidase/acylaminoacyl peptidase